MTWRPDDLAWLPPAPGDFRARCAEIESQSGDRGLALQRLAGHRLDANQLARLARAIAATPAGERVPLVPFRLGLLSNATSQHLLAPLVATAARHGIDLTVVDTPFDQGLQQAADPNSDMNRARPDAVLIAFDYRGLGFADCPPDAAEAAKRLDAAMARVRAMREGVRAACNAFAIVQTVARPVETLFGSLDRNHPATPGSLCAAFNAALAQTILGPADVLLDIAGLAEDVGLASWHDPTAWAHAKLPFAGAFVPLYADHLGRILAAVRGRSRKCLVLDLDNTLWGGVIADDGLEGLALGQGDALGEAHLEVQRYARRLHDRGILLAVASRNDEEMARLPFERHPDMILRLEHIAAFVANWDDKARNLERIAAALNIGLDALVFLDDNPAERGRVRAALTSVAVPELPADPAFFPRAMAAAGYFESVAFTGDDRNRAAQYRANAARVSLKSEAKDLDSYLRSLEMVISFAPFDAVGRSRIAQLVNKSNQFNLTTRRYTEAELAELERATDVFTLQVRLRDSLGDNGMISVVICRTGPDGAWLIDTWLMSCRVLGRRVEEAVLNELVTKARSAGVSLLRGRYVPTPRNALVREHYKNLGFRRVPSADAGPEEWELDVDSFAVKDLPMQVEHAFTRTAA